MDHGSVVVAGIRYEWFIEADDEVIVRGAGKRWVQQYDGEMLHDVRGRLSDEVADAVAADIASRAW